MASNHPSRRDALRLSLAIALLATIAACGSPKATPSPALSASPDPSAVASSAHETQLSAVDVGDTLPAGSYAVNVAFGAPFTITFASAWKLERIGVGEVVVRTDAEDPAAWITVHLVENVFADPCHSGDGPQSPAVARTVDGIVGAVSRLKGFNAGPVSEVPIGTRTATAVELTNAIDTETAGCDAGPMLPLWTIRGSAESVATNGGTRQRLWVVDVDSTPVVIVGETVPMISAAADRVIDEVVRTIEFEAP